jgi:hypothetical protein
MNLHDLEIKCEELGKEIERLKNANAKLPMSWEEIGEINGGYVNTNSEVFKIVISDACLTEFIVNQNVFKTIEQAKASLALSQLSQLKHCYKNHKDLFFDGRFDELFKQAKPLLEIFFGELTDAFLALKM